MALRALAGPLMVCLGLFLGGCSAGEDEATAADNSPSPSASPTVDKSELLGCGLTVESVEMALGQEIVYVEDNIVLDSPKCQLLTADPTGLAPGEVVGYGGAFLSITQKHDPDLCQVGGLSGSIIEADEVYDETLQDGAWICTYRQTLSEQSGFEPEWMTQITFEGTGVVRVGDNRAETAAEARATAVTIAETLQVPTAP